MNCKYCSKTLNGSPSRESRLGNKIFCDNKCQASFRTATLEQEFIDGKFIGKLIGFQTRSWTRDLLIKMKGYKCNVCSCIEHNCKPLSLEVNHIDGDAENNTLENLEFLCPNCHSQTSNFRALNKNSKRSYRYKYTTTPS